MQRKTAVAAASAISMSVLSAAIAIGATFGALGFDSASTATTAQPASVSAAATAPSSAQTAATVTSSTRGEANGREHEGTTAGAAVTTTASTQEKGQRTDD